MIGKGDIYHNNRNFIAENVDRNRVADNITIIKEDVREVYHELFDKALTEYNAKQKRKDRIIKDYHDHIRHSRQEKEFHEVIFQIGNKDDTACGTDIAKTAANILQRYAEDFQQRNPHLRMFNAVIHLDEATPHLHIDFVPFATEQKRGLSTRVSLSKALEQQGFKSEGKLNTCSKLWIENEKQYLSELMAEREIEWKQLGTDKPHLSVLDYKKQEREKEIAALDKSIAKAAAKKTKIKAVDDIQTKKTVFGDNLTVSREDYENLSDLAKKQIAAEKKEKKLKSEITQLQSENTQLKTKLSAEKKKNANSKSINLRIESEKLKCEISKLRNAIESIDEFFSRFGLVEKFREFTNSISKNKQKSKGNWSKRIVRLVLRHIKNMG